MANTIRHEFDKYLTYDNLMKAHKLSRKGKNYKKEVILFNLKQEEYIKWLYEQLKNGKYKHGGYRVFYIQEPKPRRIEASSYMDRIVHRWLVDSFLDRYFISQFITTSYACIKKRGMHKATIDVQNAMRHCTRIWGNYYILKMDIKKYFQNIDKDILLNILKRKIKEEKLLKVIESIIYSNEGKKGIPIGNYTSQIFANIYLNELDQYVKHKLKCKYYYRYMDDAVILLPTKEKTKEILEKIREYLKENLELTLNEKTQIFKSKQGINFCGYKINEYRIKIRDRGKKAIKNKIKILTKEIKEGRLTTKEAVKYISGHLGYIKIANTKNLEERIFYTET